MYSLLLAIIYLAFISLGLPDSLLGSGWPTMYPELGVHVSFAGIITIIVAIGGVISSLLSERLIKKFTPGWVTTISVLTTAVALYGFSISSEFWMLCLWAIPYGLGAGAVDAALNNYIALHYTSRQMSWLHCFWGVGAATSPAIMGFCLTRGLGWHSGYKSVALLQIVLTAILFISLPLWKKVHNNSIKNQDNQQENQDNITSKAPLKISEILKIKGVKTALIALLGYIAVEQTAGLWASSFLVLHRNIDAQIAAKYTSLFFIGITVGRFLSGIISNKMGDKNMIRIGIAVMTVGVLAIGLPITSDILCLNGLVILGLGCAPIYPSIIHATPANFGKDNSQAVIGVQMAAGGVTATTLPPLFGVLADKISMGLYPVYLFIFTVILIVMSEKLNRLISAK